MNANESLSNLAGKVDISAAGPRCKMLLGDLDGDGRMELLLVQPGNRKDVRYIPHQVQCLTAFDLQGNLLWQKGTPHPEAGGPGADYPAQIYDLDGDGQLEVLCVMDDKFLILDGCSGIVKKTYDLPSPEAHDCIIITNVSGRERPSDIILKDRYSRLWALDQNFNLLWTHQGNPGHFPWVYDWNKDGYDEVMAGYDMLDHNGNLLWSCHDLEDHADCIFTGDVNGDGKPELVIGGSVTVMYNRYGKELWRYNGSIESQHVALGKFREDLPGLQVAGLDRIIRGNPAKQIEGKDGMFLLDAGGQEIWKEERTTSGWLTIIETLHNWDEGPLDYILAYRRGGGVFPTLYDGYMNAVVTFPVDGYVTHADLLGGDQEQVIIYDNDAASIFSNQMIDLSASASGKALAQSKRLYSSTLYPGGEIECY
ncbi:Repeat domain-containing protein [Paenibacillus sp. 1_12]|uniref:rhamnogalacturonan lyase family protein n=1 Tax=Paenibacillus sp. 1_12 TaxID=1566278 RepID=UPI0008F05995|nr:FG-GAP-like repeat-containing protein [Paenibacillus sp. 1_12]SFK99287.1 Repeat domain-containing protein [Paenibacillus sp. 1_12]